jgi:hypothetical protein
MGASAGEATHTHQFGHVLVVSGGHVLVVSVNSLNAPASPVPLWVQRILVS